MRCPFVAPQSIQWHIGQTTSRRAINGWMAAFDARWTWLSSLVVRECVVGERGEMQRSTPLASGASGWIGSISAAVRAVVSGRARFRAG